MNITKVETKYLIIDGLNKAELTINHLTQSYSIYRRAVKNETFLQKIEEYAEKLVKNT